MLETLRIGHLDILQWVKHDETSECDILPLWSVMLTLNHQHITSQYGLYFNEIFAFCCCYFFQFTVLRIETLILDKCLFW